MKDKQKLSQVELLVVDEAAAISCLLLLMVMKVLDALYH